jgi:hypothetical protein
MHPEKKRENETSLSAKSMICAALHVFAKSDRSLIGIK